MNSGLPSRDTCCQPPSGNTCCAVDDEPLAVASARGEARPAHGGIDADAGLLPEEHGVVRFGNAELLELTDRDLHHDRQHVESLETIDAVAVLAEAVGEAAVVVEDARIQQIEDSRNVGIEAVIAMTGPDHLARAQRVDRRTRVDVEIRQRRRARNCLARRGSL